MLFIMLYKVLLTFESQKHSGSPGGGYSHLQAIWVCAAVKGMAFTSFAAPPPPPPNSLQEYLQERKNFSVMLFSFCARCVLKQWFL